MEHWSGSVRGVEGQWLHERLPVSPLSPGTVADKTFRQQGFVVDFMSMCISTLHGFGSH